MSGFWRSAEGQWIRRERRRWAALLVDLPIEPPTKNSRAGTRKKARDAVVEAFTSDELVHYARRYAPWPKPRAAIALDIYVVSGSRNGARIDSICKWLLDELAGHVYVDDRQVKLLFAAIARPQQYPAAADSEWGSTPPSAWTAPNALSGRTYVTAQTRANVLDDLRTSADFDERWDPFADEYAPHRDPIEADFHRDTLVDYRSMFHPQSDADANEYQRIGHQIDYSDQVQQQRLVDLIFSSLLVDLPVDPFNIWGQVRSRLAYSPYIFDIGVLPERGGSADFQNNLRQLLQERRDRYPQLFPMRATSGISMILFENPAAGKDLDNLIRSALPAILDVLRPPQTDLQGWVADEPDPATGSVDIPFIEVAAIPAERADMAPGSVIFGLSSGYRRDSWWAKIAEHVDRTLEELRGY